MLANPAKYKNKIPSLFIFIKLPIFETTIYRLKSWLKIQKLNKSSEKRNDYQSQEQLRRIQDLLFKKARTERSPENIDR